MNETVTLLKSEYDRLMKLEYEAHTLENVMKNNEPVIVKFRRNRYDDEIAFSVYYGVDKVKELIREYSENLSWLEENQKKQEKRYKEDQEKLIKIKELLNN